MKNCRECSNAFIKPVNRSTREWAKTQYCSKSCANRANSRSNQRALSSTPWNKGLKMGESPFNSQRLKQCLECGLDFKVKQYRFETAKFCSRICKHKSQDTGKTQENYRIRRSVQYIQWRRQVFIRDNYTCQHCQQRGGALQADHIKQFAYYPELRFEVNNGRTLCVECHKKTPTWGNNSPLLT